MARDAVNKLGKGTDLQPQPRHQSVRACCRLVQWRIQKKSVPCVRFTLNEWWGGWGNLTFVKEGLTKFDC